MQVLIGSRLTLEPSVQHHQVQNDILLALRFTRGALKNVHPAGRAKGNDGSVAKLQLDESLVGTLDDVALPDAHSLRALERGCSSNDTWGSLQQGDQCY